MRSVQVTQNSLRGQSFAQYLRPPNALSVAIYYTDDTQVIGSGSETVVDFQAAQVDIFSAVTTGASWNFACPDGKIGWYYVNSHIEYASASWPANAPYYLIPYVGATAWPMLDLRYTQALGTYLVALGGSGLVYLTNDDTLSIKAYQNSTGNKTISASATKCYVQIWSLGIK